MKRFDDPLSLAGPLDGTFKVNMRNYLIRFGGRTRCLPKAGTGNQPKRVTCPEPKNDATKECSQPGVFHDFSAPLARGMDDKDKLPGPPARPSCRATPGWRPRSASSAG